jgi:acyl-CoA thioester hydrolase
MTAKRRLVHTEILTIRWGDMDALGHVNNTVYFRYMEQARISWFDGLGLIGSPSGEGPALINASCTFLKQLVYPGDVEVKTYVGRAGRSTFETWIELRPSYDPDVVYAEGSAKVVWVDYAKSKSAPLPDKLRSAVER